jgi:hypothetical protein
LSTAFFVSLCSLVGAMTQKYGVSDEMRPSVLMACRRKLTFFCGMEE